MNRATSVSPGIPRLRAVSVWLLLAAALGLGLAQEQGGVRFAHQSADAPLVDVVVDGRAIFRDVGFGTVTGYVPMRPGRHEITVFPHRLREADMAAVGPSEGEGEQTGSPQARQIEPVTTFVTVEEGGYHTAVLTGFYEPPAAERQLGHLSLSVMPEGTTFGISGPRGYAAEFTGDQLLTGIQPGTYTITADREGYRAATYEAEVHPRRTTTVSIALQEGEEAEEPSTRTIGSPNGADAWASLQVQIFDDAFDGVPEAGAAKVRIVHASPTSPDLRIVAEPAGDAGGDAVELGALGYPEAGAYVSVPAGRYAIRFGVQGLAQTVAALDGVDLRAGTVLTFFLTSEPAESRPRVVVTVDAAMMGIGADR